MKTFFFSEGLAWFLFTSEACWNKKTQKNQNTNLKQKSLILSTCLALHWLTNIYTKASANLENLAAG